MEVRNFSIRLEESIRGGIMEDYTYAVNTVTDWLWQEGEHNEIQEEE